MRCLGPRSPTFGVSFSRRVTRSPQFVGRLCQSMKRSRRRLMENTLRPPASSGRGSVRGILSRGGLRSGWRTSSGRGRLAEKFDLRLAEPDEIHRGDRNGSVDREDRDLELVARLDRIGKHHAIGYVETLDGGRAGVAGAARDLPVDPDLRVI